MLSSGYVLKYLTLVSSFFSIIFLFLLFKDNRFILIYMISNIFLFCTITPVWQEYFDPLSLVFLILFGNKLTSSISSNKFVYFLIVYLIIFLGTSIIDQNYLVNI